MVRRSSAGPCRRGVVRAGGDHVVSIRRARALEEGSGARTLRSRTYLYENANSTAGRHTSHRRLHGHPALPVTAQSCLGRRVRLGSDGRADSMTESTSSCDDQSVLGKDSRAPIRRHPRAWPWAVLAVVGSVAVTSVSDGMGWLWWARGLLMGAWLGVFSGLAGRAWRERRAERTAWDISS